jgi:glutamyl-tRNA(Gln) amidotransferase subunit D
MLPETALVKLMWVLGQTREVDEAKKLLKTNIAGELSPRTLPEKTFSELGEGAKNGS